MRRSWTLLPVIVWNDPVRARGEINAPCQPKLCRSMAWSVVWVDHLFLGKPLDAVSTITSGCMDLLQVAFSPFSCGWVGVLQGVFPPAISEGLDMGECVGLQTSGPDCATRRGVRTAT